MLCAKAERTGEMAFYETNKSIAHVIGFTFPVFDAAQTSCSRASFGTVGWYNWDHGERPVTLLL